MAFDLGGIYDLATNIPNTLPNEALQLPTIRKLNFSKYMLNQKENETFNPNCIEGGGKPCDAK